MDKVFSVFIIGAMGQQKGALAGHTAAMKEALKITFEQLGFEEHQVSIKIPDELSSSGIVDSVFHEMDMADLAVVDISSRSPNVFYELAFFNALGTPFIAFDLEQSDGSVDIPFYFNQTRMERVPEFTVKTLSKSLLQRLKSFFDRGEMIDLTNNPLSRFYDMPLIDISAATGLAVGYFDNFVRHVIMEGTGAIAMDENALDKLIIVRPAGLGSFTQDEKRIKAAFPDASDLKATALSHRRKAVFLNCVKDGQAIDLPTAIYTLEQSPRYKKLKERVSKFQNLDRTEGTQALDRLGEKMIDAFFKTLEFLIKEDRSLSTTSYKVVNVVDLVR